VTGNGKGGIMKTSLKIVIVQVLVLLLSGVAFGQTPRKITLRLDVPEGADSRMVRNAVRARLGDRYDVVGMGIVANFSVDIGCLKIRATDSFACYTSIAFWPESNLTISFTSPSLVIGSADVAEKAAINYIRENINDERLELLWRVYAGGLIGACKNMKCSPSGADCAFTNTHQ
jgi:hypothetical protein